MTQRQIQDRIRELQTRLIQLEASTQRHDYNVWAEKQLLEYDLINLSMQIDDLISDLNQTPPSGAY